NWLAGGIAHARPLQVFEPRGAPFVTGEPSSASAPGPSWLRCPCRLAAFDYQTSADLRRAVSDAFEAIGDRRRIRQEEDRKSTRLNSSHGSTSYAFFCL